MRTLVLAAIVTLLATPGKAENLRPDELKPEHYLACHSVSSVNKYTRDYRAIRAGVDAFRPATSFTPSKQPRWPIGCELRMGTELWIRDTAGHELIETGNGTIESVYIVRAQRDDQVRCGSTDYYYVFYLREVYQDI